MTQKTFDPKHPNIYVHMLPEYKDWIYVEEEAVPFKGKWSSLFADPSLPLDLEIGCGNGFFFENVVRDNPGRNFLAMELKYKPLVQTIRRVKRVNAPNAKGIRYHARFLDRIFAPQELHNVYIYFPDPWPKTRHEKNRLLRADFFKNLFELQKFGMWVDFKTDSADYFKFVESEIIKTPYKVSRHSLDLHKSEWAAENFFTAFEKIFMAKGQPIFYMRFSTNTL